MLAILGLSNSDLHTALVAGLTALVVTLLTLPLKEWVRLLVETKLHKNKADTDYRVAQRKALAEAIATHHGRLIDAADRFAHRMTKVEKHAHDGWLDPSRPESDGYFLDSTIYRFVVLVGAAESLEQEGLVIDRRVGKPEDQKLVWYARALRWSLTAADLFDGTGYNAEKATDHFFTDTLRDIGRCGVANEQEITFRAFCERSYADEVFAPARQYFTALEPGQLRWDRLMVSRLIVMALLNDYGDDVQASSQEWFDRVASLIENDHIAANFRTEWLPRFQLGSAPLERAMTKRLAAATRVAQTSE